MLINGKARTAETIGCLTRIVAQARHRGPGRIDEVRRMQRARSL